MGGRFAEHCWMSTADQFSFDFKNGQIVLTAAAAAAAASKPRTVALFERLSKAVHGDVKGCKLAEQRGQVDGFHSGASRFCPALAFIRRHPVSTWRRMREALGSGWLEVSSR